MKETLRMLRALIWFDINNFYVKQVIRYYRWLFYKLIKISFRRRSSWRDELDAERNETAEKRRKLRRGGGGRVGGWEEGLRCLLIFRFFVRDQRAKKITTTKKICLSVCVSVFVCVWMSGRVDEWIGGCARTSPPLPQPPFLLGTDKMTEKEIYLTRYFQSNSRFP